MAKEKVGALICLEKGNSINFVEETGVPVDAVVSHSFGIYIHKKQRVT